MSINLNSVMKSKAINGWSLFWLIAIPMSLVNTVVLLGTDLSTGAGVSSMIGFSVRTAVPFIFLIVAISSIQTLFPGPIPMWLLRNRTQIGMCFATAMAWQGLFIFMMSVFFRDYYYADVYLLRDEIEGSIGYLFLPAMVLTSFQFVRKHLTPKQWKLIHKTGIYFLFAYPFSVYWWNVSYYPNPESMDYLYYWGGFLAWTLRITAWAKKRRLAASKIGPDASTPFALTVLGAAVVVFGIVVASSGRQWQEPVTSYLTSAQWSADLVLWLPYWPLEPYFSLFIIGFGALLMTRSRALQ